jgi:hypothetical protein
LEKLVDLGVPHASYALVVIQKPLDHIGGRISVDAAVRSGGDLWRLR